MITEKETMVMAVTLTKFGAFTTSNVAVEEVIVAEGFMVVLSLGVLPNMVRRKNVELRAHVWIRRFSHCFETRSDH